MLWCLCPCDMFLSLYLSLSISLSICLYLSLFVSLSPSVSLCASLTSPRPFHKRPRPWGSKTPFSCYDLCVRMKHRRASIGGGPSAPPRRAPLATPRGAPLERPVKRTGAPVVATTLTNPALKQQRKQTERHKGKRE